METGVQGKIIKSIAGFYEVYAGGTIYRCRARGVFRALGKKPLVGDDVRIEITDEVSDPKEGSVIALLPRRKELVRPNVANVDQALLIFAVTNPAPSYNMLDRFLIEMQNRDLPAILCFNKTDLARKEDLELLKATYEACGCRIFFISTRQQESLEPVKEALLHKTTVLTGPSGVGKSSLINELVPGSPMETGELSRKLARGKNTTRHVELLAAGEDTFLVDTPGFTSLYLADVAPEDVKNYYEEFAPYAGQCRFAGCNHISEPGCAVKQAVEEGKISKIRYQNYREIFDMLRDMKPDYTKPKKSEKG